MNCPYCNTPIPNGAQCCPGCDTPISPMVPQGQCAPQPQYGQVPPQGQYASSGTPRLYNPNAAANWSILLTPVFGSWCVYTNYKQLGEKSRAQTSLAVTILIAVATVFGPLLSMFAPVPDAVGRAIPFVALILWYFIEAKGQVNFIKTRGIVYEKKPWGTPVLIGVLAVVLYLGFMFALGRTVGAFLTGLKRDVPKGAKTEAELTQQKIAKVKKGTLFYNRQRQIEDVLLVNLADLTWDYGVPRHYSEHRCPKLFALAKQGKTLVMASGIWKGKKLSWDYHAQRYREDGPFNCTADLKPGNRVTLFFALNDDGSFELTAATICYKSYSRADPTPTDEYCEIRPDEKLFIQFLEVLYQHP